MCTARSLTVSHSICWRSVHAMHAPWNACPPPPCNTLPHMPPLPCMPPAMHASPPCMPPTMHAPLATCTPPAMYTPTMHGPPATHAPLPCMPDMDRILNTCFWKYYLAPTSLQAVKMEFQKHLFHSVSYLTVFEMHVRSITGWIQILVLTNCQAISTEIATDSLKI